MDDGQHYLRGQRFAIGEELEKALELLGKRRVSKDLMVSEYKQGP